MPSKYTTEQGRYQKLYEHLAATIQNDNEPAYLLLQAATQYDLAHGNRSSVGRLSKTPHRKTLEKLSVGHRPSVVANRIVLGHASDLDMDEYMDWAICYIAETLLPQEQKTKEIVVFLLTLEQVSTLIQSGGHQPNDEMLQQMFSHLQVILQSTVEKEVSIMLNAHKAAGGTARLGAGETKLATLRDLCSGWYGEWEKTHRITIQDGRIGYDKIKAMYGRRRYYANVSNGKGKGRNFPLTEVSTLHPLDHFVERDGRYELKPEHRP